MSQIENLEVLVKEWEDKYKRMQLESSFARKHNFNLEAQVLWDQAALICDFCIQIRAKLLNK